MKAGWDSKKLGDVCAFLSRGISPKYLEEGGLCVLNQKCIRDHQINYALSRRHDSSAKRVASDRFIQLGDVLVNSTGTGTLGRVAQVREEPPESTTVDSHVTIVRPIPATFHLDFFGYMLVAAEDAIKQAGDGCGGQTELARSVLAERVVVSYPKSIPEQQRIVSILDKAFEGIATARANAEQNLQSARALFESHLNTVFTRRGAGWVEKKLEEVANSDCSLAYGIVQPGEDVEDGVPIVRPTDLTTKVIRLSGLKRIDPKVAEGYKRTVLQGGELLLCVRGSTGVVAMSSPELVGANVTRGIVPIRFDPSLVLSEFGFYLIRSGSVQSQIREKTYGAALMQINIRDLRVISLSFPPLREQRLIAEKLDSLHDETQSLSRLYGKKLAALESLKQSLLQQAFIGNL